VSTGLETVPV